MGAIFRCRASTTILFTAARTHAHPSVRNAQESTAQREEAKKKNEQNSSIKSMNPIENIEPTVKVLPLQTRTESILARMNADYEAERAKIRKKIGEERECIDALEVIRAQHKDKIRKLTNEEDQLRVAYMQEKARVLEEAEYNRVKDGVC